MIQSRWLDSMQEREYIDKNVVTLLPTARTNILDAKAVQLERNRHADEAKVVQKICDDLHMVVSKILQDIEVLFE